MLFLFNLNKANIGYFYFKNNFLWLKSTSIINDILMRKSCLYFDKTYKCVSFLVHYTNITLNKCVHLVYISADFQLCLINLYFFFRSIAKLFIPTDTNLSRPLIPNESISFFFQLCHTV